MTDQPAVTPTDTCEPPWMSESREYDLLVVAANLMQRWRDKPSDLFEQDQVQNARLLRERDKWLADYERHARRAADAAASLPAALDVDLLAEAMQDAENNGASFASLTMDRLARAVAAEYDRLTERSNL